MCRGNQEARTFLMCAEWPRTGAYMWYAVSVSRPAAAPHFRPRAAMGSVAQRTTIRSDPPNDDSALALNMGRPIALAANYRNLLSETSRTAREQPLSSYHTKHSAQPLKTRTRHRQTRDGMAHTAAPAVADSQIIFVISRFSPHQNRVSQGARKRNQPSAGELSSHLTYARPTRRRCCLRSTQPPYCSPSSTPRRCRRAPCTS